MRLYNNIKTIAKQQKIPIYKIEEEIGIASGSMCKWNEISPSVDKVLGVAKMLGTTVEELFRNGE